MVIYETLSPLLLYSFAEPRFFFTTSCYYDIMKKKFRGGGLSEYNVIVKGGLRNYNKL